MAGLAAHDVVAESSMAAVGGKCWVICQWIEVLGAALVEERSAITRQEISCLTRKLGGKRIQDVKSGALYSRTLSRSR